MDLLQDKKKNTRPPHQADILIHEYSLVGTHTDRSSWSTSMRKLYPTRTKPRVSEHQPELQPFPGTQPCGLISQLHIRDGDPVSLKEVGVLVRVFLTPEEPQKNSLCSGKSKRHIEARSPKDDQAACGDLQFKHHGYPAQILPEHPSTAS